MSAVEEAVSACVSAIVLEFGDVVLQTVAVSLVECALSRIGEICSVAMALEESASASFSYKAGCWDFLASPFAARKHTGTIDGALSSNTCLQYRAERALRDWEESVRDMLARIRAIRIKSAGKISYIQTGAGDWHQFRGSTTLLAFENASTCFYKPRDPAPDILVRSLLGVFVEEQILETNFCPPMFSSEDFCLSRAVWPGTFVQEDAASYYRKVGQLISFCILIAADDLHHQNLVASQEGPIVFDWETLGARSLPSSPEQIDYVIDSTGLLPSVSGINLTSGLCPPHRSTEPHPANVPRGLRETFRLSAYRDSILSGVESAAYKLRAFDESSPSTIADFFRRARAMSARLVVRPTEFYAAVLVEAGKQELFYGSTGRAKAIKDHLSFVNDHYLPQSELLPFEVAALMADMIPSFYTLGPNIISSGGKVICARPSENWKPDSSRLAQIDQLTDAIARRIDAAALN